MELIPKGLIHVTGEGSSRILALVDDFASTVFDSNPIWCEVATAVGSRARTDDNRGRAGIYSHCGFWHTFGVSHEHIYWNRASVLVQIGLLKREKILITGTLEQTKKLVELSKSQEQTGLSSPAKR